VGSSRGRSHVDARPCGSRLGGRLLQLWQKHIAQFPNVTMPPNLLKFKELVLDEKDRLHEVWRPPGAFALRCGRPLPRHGRRGI